MMIAWRSWLVLVDGATVPGALAIRRTRSRPSLPPSYGTFARALELHAQRQVSRPYTIKLAVSHAGADKRQHGPSRRLCRGGVGVQVWEVSRKVRRKGRFCDRHWGRSFRRADRTRRPYAYSGTFIMGKIEARGLRWREARTGPSSDTLRQHRTLGTRQSSSYRGRCGGLRR